MTDKTITANDENVCAITELKVKRNLGLDKHFELNSKYFFLNIVKHLPRSYLAK